MLYSVDLMKDGEWMDHTLGYGCYIISKVNDYLNILTSGRRFLELVVKFYRNTQKMKIWIILWSLELIVTTRIPIQFHSFGDVKCFWVSVVLFFFLIMRHKDETVDGQTFFLFMLQNDVSWPSVRWFFEMVSPSVCFWVK